MERAVVRPGRNSVVLVARDAAGNVRSAGVRVTRVVPTTRLTLAPATRTLLVDELATLSLRDDSGLAVMGATWAASDPGVVTLSVDDPPVLTALAGGTATITATHDGVSAAASITVVAGTSLPDGTTRWSVAPAPGWTMGAPLYTHRVDETVPDLFAVETEVTTGAVTLHALTASGEAQGTEAAPGEPVMGDSFGGVVADVGEGRGLARLGGPAAALPWRYDSPGYIGRPAQGSDGTIYTRELLSSTDNHGAPIWDEAVVVLDGATGAVRARVPLPRDVFGYEAALDGLYLPELERTCRSERWEAAPQVSDPVVGSDGRAYLQVRQLSQQEAGDCVASDATARHDDHRVQLLAVDATGAVTSDTLYTYTGDTPVPGCGGWVPDVGQTVPDGQEGVLATWSRSTCGATPYDVVTETRVTRRAADATLAEHAFPADTTIAMTGDAATAYLTPQLGGTVTAVDVMTWSTKWTSAAAGEPVMAIAGGGVALHSGATGEIHIVDSDGASAGSVNVNLTDGGSSAPGSFLEYGLWIGRRAGALAATAGPLLEEALVSFLWGETTDLRGDPQRQSSARTIPGFGIFAKGHGVGNFYSPFRHVAIRVVPKNQDYWLQRDAQLPEGVRLFTHRDVRNHAYLTLGAGPASVGCSGTLVSAPNREHDLSDPPRNLELLMYPPVNEDAFISTLRVSDESATEETHMRWWLRLFLTMAEGVVVAAAVQTLVLIVLRPYRPWSYEVIDLLVVATGPIVGFGFVFRRYRPYSIVLAVVFFPMTIAVMAFLGLFVACSIYGDCL